MKKDFYHGISQSYVVAEKIEESEILKMDISYYFTCEKENCDIFRAPNYLDFYYVEN